MANELLYGLTPQDYAAAQALGYSNQSFNALGADGTRAALKNKTKFQPAVAAPTATASASQQYSSFDDGGLKSMGDYSAENPYRAPEPVSQANPYAGSTSAGMYQSGASTDNLLDYDTRDQGMSYNDPYSGSGSIVGIEDQNAGLYNAYENSLNSETALRNAQIDDLQGFDWMGAGGLAMSGVNTAMEIGLYGDKKDYMENANKAMDQNLQNAEEDFNTRQTNKSNYGSTFSRN